MLFLLKVNYIIFFFYILDLAATEQVASHTHKDIPLRKQACLDTKNTVSCMGKIRKTGGMVLKLKHIDKNILLVYITLDRILGSEIHVPLFSLLYVRVLLETFISNQPVLRWHNPIPLIPCRMVYVNMEVYLLIQNSEFLFKFL